MSLSQKFSQALHFLRYGPTELADGRARVADLEQRQSAQEELLTRFYEALERDRKASTSAFQSLVERLDGLNRELAVARQDVAGVNRELVAARQELAGAMQELAVVSRTELATSTATLTQALQTTDDDRRRESSWTRDQLSAFAAALDRVQPPAAANSQAAPAGPTASAAFAEEGFYLALERQFRGTPEDVRIRLESYRPWIEGLPSGPVGDLGCGRGEWLELLGEWGVPNQGIDLNSVNVEHMRARGLSAQEGDALQWLESQATDSFAALTAFHVLEHLPFGVLLRLVQEARRVLLPGGRLILETPNPENLAVATQTFWLDPTHLRPLPPELLELVVRHAGLEHEETLRLHPPDGGAEEIGDATLRALLTQGRDYAIVARKPVVDIA